MKIKDNKESKSPTVNKAVLSIKKSDAKKKEIQKSKHPRGIIMLSHIPHGFYEKQMTNFFRQFGKVHRVKVARSKKTGKSKGYGYVEFEFEEVARIAAETMDNYLMFERLVKCKLLGPDANARLIFADRFIRPKNCPTLKNRKKLKIKQDVPKTQEEQEASKNARLLKLKQKNAKLAKLGIDYEFTPSGINLDNVSPIKTPKQKEEKKQDQTNGDNKKNSSKKGGNAKKSPATNATTTTTTTAITTTPIRKRKTSVSNEDNSNNNNISITKDIIEKVPTPKKAKKSLTPAIKLNLISTPQQQQKVTTQNNADNNNSNNDNNKKKAKTPELKKSTFSPKQLRSRVSLKPQTPINTISLDTSISSNTSSSKKQKVKTPAIIDKTPKISPKVLRSRKSMKPEETPTPTIKTNNRKSTNNNKDEKTPKIKKIEFSPKLLRSSIKQKI